MFRRTFATLGITALLGACSLTIDGDALQGGADQLKCGDAEKACTVDGEASCVSHEDPDFGCGAPTCAPCALTKATSVCSPSTFECLIGACIGSWEDCDEEPDNGCETNTDTDVAACGGCRQPCPTKPNADVSCGSAHCYIRSCAEGYKDCNKKFDDGCEVNVLTSALHCGACSSPCAGTCTDGVCIP